MSKFKQALMISAMVFLGAFVILSLVKDQMRQERQIQHYRQLDSLLESTGLDYIEDFNPFAETTDMRIGLYADGEGYGIVTACLAPEEITGGEVLRSAMYPVDTGDETVQAWYGICGTEAEPQLLLLLDEDNPRFPGSGSGGKQNCWSDGYEGNGAEDPHRSQRTSGRWEPDRGNPLYRGSAGSGSEKRVQFQQRDRTDRAGSLRRGTENQGDPGALPLLYNRPERSS